MHIRGRWESFSMFSKNWLKIMFSILSSIYYLFYEGKNNLTICRRIGNVFQFLQCSSQSYVSYYTPIGSSVFDHFIGGEGAVCGSVWLSYLYLQYSPQPFSNIYYILTRSAFNCVQLNLLYIYKSCMY